MDFESNTLGTIRCISTSGLSLGPFIDKKTLKKKVIIHAIMLLKIIKYLWVHTNNLFVQ